MTYVIKKISEICEIFSGGTPSRTKLEYFGGGIPWVKITDMLQGTVKTTGESLTEAGLNNSSARLMPSGTVLISIFATIGRTAVLGIEAATNQAIAGVVPKDVNQLDPFYLRYFLDSQHEELNRAARGVAQPNINQGILKALDVPVPNIAEQRRIVDILSRAEGIVQLRREAEKKASEIIPALFIDMFGDPATNPKGWPIVPFSSLGDCRLGKMLDKKKQSGQFQKPYLRNVNVQWDRIDTYDLYEMDFRPDEQNTLRLKNGDVLICEGGEIGRAAIWNSQIEECYYQKALHCLRPDATVTRADFVVWLLWHLARSGSLTGSTTHSTIAHLTGVQLKNLQVISPFVTIQDDFTHRVIDCHSIQTQQTAATQKAKATFDALLASFFSHTLAEGVAV